MSASLSKRKAEKRADEWAWCNFTISKHFCHATEVTQMSLFRSFLIFTHFRFLTYQDTNGILERRKGCISSFFGQPAPVPRGKKPNHPPPPHPRRSSRCSELFLQIWEAAMWRAELHPVPVWGCSEAFEMVAELCPGRKKCRWLICK